MRMLMGLLVVASLSGCCSRPMSDEKVLEVSGSFIQGCVAGGYAMALKFHSEADVGMLEIFCMDMLLRYHRQLKEQYNESIREDKRSPSGKGSEGSEAFS